MTHPVTRYTQTQNEGEIWGFIETQVQTDIREIRDEASYLLVLDKYKVLQAYPQYQQWLKKAATAWLSYESRPISPAMKECKKELISFLEQDRPPAKLATLWLSFFQLPFFENKRFFISRLAQHLIPLFRTLSSTAQTVSGEAKLPLCTQRLSNPYYALIDALAYEDLQQDYSPAADIHSTVRIKSSEQGEANNTQPHEHQLLVLNTLYIILIDQDERCLLPIIERLQRIEEKIQQQQPSILFPANSIEESFILHLTDFFTVWVRYDNKNALKSSQTSLIDTLINLLLFDLMTSEIPNPHFLEHGFWHRLALGVLDTKVVQRSTSNNDISSLCMLFRNYCHMFRVWKLQTHIDTVRLHSLMKIVERSLIGGPLQVKAILPQRLWLLLKEAFVDDVQYLEENTALANKNLVVVPGPLLNRIAILIANGYHFVGGFSKDNVLNDLSENLQNPDALFFFSRPFHSTNRIDNFKHPFLHSLQIKKRSNGQYLPILEEENDERKEQVSCVPPNHK